MNADNDTITLSSTSSMPVKRGYESDRPAPGRSGYERSRPPMRTYSRPAAPPPPPKPAVEKPVKVVVPVNAALKREWDKLSKIIVTSSRDDARAWDAKYEAIAEVVAHDPPLYLAGGFADFQSFANKFLKEDARLVRDWMAVATHASPNEVLLYTPTKLALLLALLRAQSPNGSLPKTIPWKTVRVLVGTKDGKPVKKTAVELSLTEIRAARRLALDKSGKRPPGEPNEVSELRAELAANKLSGVTVKYHDGALTFSDVPVYALKTFAVLLAKTKWE